uniref:Uncharacterized protein n=1 Tax=Lepeophtheirus salmonis TaxID=72036 RepID=A0A0K2VLQ3_LEPSM
MLHNELLILWQLYLKHINIYLYVSLCTQ